MSDPTTPTSATDTAAVVQTPATLPDRLSVDPKSPFYNPDVLNVTLAFALTAWKKPMLKSIASAKAGYA
jgi:hypothetical protein